MVVKRHIWHWAVVQCQLQVLFYVIPHVFLVSFPFARGIFSQMDELSINHHQVSFWVCVCVFLDLSPDISIDQTLCVL